MVAIAVACILVVLVGSAPALVPLVFGSPWADAANVLPGAGVAYVVGAPISVATAGYLFAVDRAGTVLRAAILHTIALAIVTFPLLPSLGVTAVGIGTGASGLVEAVVLGRAAASATGARMVRAVAVPASAAAVSAALGWVLTSQTDPTVPVAALGAGTALGLYLVLLVILDRTRLRQMITVVRRSVGAATAPRAADTLGMPDTGMP
jgi:O-antigen/teichoic acid export membrane protein